MQDWRDRQKWPEYEVRFQEHGKYEATRRGNGKKRYARATKPEEIIFVNTNGLSSEILIKNRYWIGVVYYYSHFYLSFFTKTKPQLPENMEAFFEKMMSHRTPVNYLYCDNARKQQSKLKIVWEK